MPQATNTVLYKRMKSIEVKRARVIREGGGSQLTPVKSHGGRRHQRKKEWSRAPEASEFNICAAATPALIYIPDFAHLAMKFKEKIKEH